MTIVPGCANCGDCCGWRIWQSLEFSKGTVEYIWIPCEVCNSDGTKPKPEVCAKCHNTPALCVCDSVSKMD